MYKHSPYLAAKRLTTPSDSENEEPKISQLTDVQSFKAEKESSESPYHSSVDICDSSTKILDILHKTIEISSTTIREDVHDFKAKTEDKSLFHGSGHHWFPCYTKHKPTITSDHKSKRSILDPIRRWNSFHTKNAKNTTMTTLQSKLCNASESLVTAVINQDKVQYQSDIGSNECVMMVETSGHKTRCKSESNFLESQDPKTTPNGRRQRTYSDSFKRMYNEKPDLSPAKNRCNSALSFSQRPNGNGNEIKGILKVSKENLRVSESIRVRTYSDSSILTSDMKCFAEEEPNSARDVQDITEYCSDVSRTCERSPLPASVPLSVTQQNAQPERNVCQSSSLLSSTMLNNQTSVSSQEQVAGSHQSSACLLRAEPCRVIVDCESDLLMNSQAELENQESHRQSSFDHNIAGGKDEPAASSSHILTEINQPKIREKEEWRFLNSSRSTNMSCSCGKKNHDKCNIVRGGNKSVSQVISFIDANMIYKNAVSMENIFTSDTIDSANLATESSPLLSRIITESQHTTSNESGISMTCDKSQYNEQNQSEQNVSTDEESVVISNRTLDTSEIFGEKCTNLSNSLNQRDEESNGSYGSQDLDESSSTLILSTGKDSTVKLNCDNVRKSIDGFSDTEVTSKFERLSLKFASKGHKARREYLESFINEKPQLDLYSVAGKSKVVVERPMSSKLNRSDPCLHSPGAYEPHLGSRPRRQRRPPAAPLPRRRFSVCFGKRSGGSSRRPNECFVLEPSEMIVIDYADTEPSRTLRTPLSSQAHLMDHSHQHQHRPINLMFEDSPVITGNGGRIGAGNNMALYQKCSRGSHSSDTSSAYSGSDTMASTHSELGESDELPDLTGIAETIVDSDEDDDLAESMDSLTVRDTVRECLEKDPSERQDYDIAVLMEFTQHLKAFTNMTLAVRRALCQVMVFAVVEKAGTIVMNDREELDSWSVLVNGSVEVCIVNEPPRTLGLGDSFGILPTMDKLYHQGVMRTKCDDCQFVCITQNDYYRIQHQGEENTRRHEENGQTVLVTELRGSNDGINNRRGYVAIRGTVESLMQQLVEENSLTDPTYVEDFLLTHRTFISSPLHLANKLMEWFKEEPIRDRVTRVVLLWVNNHFTDFETDPNMIEFLEKFEQNLEAENKTGQLRLLNIACAAKARVRNVVLARPSRDEPLSFQILGGFERNFGIFISKVDKNSKAEDVGLKRGDQILEVNGQSFEHVSHARALEILRGTTHLSITVKSNLKHFKEMLNTPDNSPRPRSRKVSEISRLQADPRARLSSVDAAGIIIPGGINDSPCSRPVALHSPHKEKSVKSFMTLGPKRRLQKALMKINILPRYIIYTDGTVCNNGLVQEPLSTAPPPGTLYQSQSNPDLMSLCYDDSKCTDYPEHVLKVYKPDQNCKYLLIHKETTAHEVVMLALQEFGMTEPSSNYSLCEVSVSNGHAIKQRRLPDQLQNLAERIGLSSRYYLKTNGITETLVPDELAGELVRESQVHFLQLNAVEVAIQLTLQDFSIFRQIEPTEYIDDLFELKSRYGTPMLGQFAELVNREMFWVVTEVCSESNVVRRSKIIKQFIKVARQCKECKNFNSMFAIVSGLGHGAVSRLRQSWERLPGKYQRVFHDLQSLMDPSRNMSKYRQLVSDEQALPPIIPFYPVVKKDLTFINLGNDSRVENLINFEKLRMIAKEVRSLTNMCSSQYDLLTMLELGGQPPSSAMVALNQLTTAVGSSHHSGQATVKRRKKSTAALNPKKMFEESQMVRRVKAYLNNMNVINDEAKLHALSVECEGNLSNSGSGSGHGSGSTGGSGQPARKRHASPAPSTASSTSTTSDERKPSATKFGAASPQAVRKLLSLSEPGKTRPHQPPRQSSGVCLTSAGVNVLPPGLLPPNLIPPLNQPGRRPPSATGSYSGSYTHAPGAGGRAMHERSHSDTPTPLPSVALSAESSSVTSLSNLPLRKTLTSGSVASTDSGHSTGAETHSNSSADSNLPPLPPSGSTHSSLVHNIFVPPSAPKGGNNRRQPPAYSVAAQMARLHRIGRAHSHEGCHFHTDPDTDQDDEDTQVSAV